MPLLLITVLAYRQVIGSLRSQAHGRMHQQSRAVARGVVDRLSLLRTTLDLVALQPATYPGHLEVAPQLAQQLGRSFRSLSLAPPHGPTVAILGRPEPKRAALSPEQLRHLHDGHTLLLTRHSESGTSEVRGRLAGTMVGEVLLGHAVQHSGVNVGVLWARVDPEFLWGVGSTSALPFRTELCVVEGEGDILFRSLGVPDWLGRRAVAATRVAPERWFEWHDRGQTFLAGLWQIPMETSYLAPTWTVVVSEAKEDVLAPIADFRRDFPLSVILSLWVVVLLGIIQIRRSLEPLLKLREATRRLGNQDFSGRIELASQDEFQELAQAFNAMSDRLGRQFRALSTMAAIGRAALSVTGAEGVIRIALDGMREAFPCDHAGVTVLVADRPDRAQTYVAPWSATAGGDPPVAPVAHSSRAIPGLGALEKGRTHHQRSGDLPSDPVDLAGAGLRSLVSVPLLAESGLLGVLSLAARDQDAFEGEHLRYAREVADQLAVALHQARLQDQLHAERHRLAGLLEQLPDGVVVLDADRQLVLTNQAARSFLPSLAAARAGDRLDRVGRLPVDEVARLPAGLVHELAGESPEHQVLQLAASRLDQPPGAVVLILRDLTRQRTIEERVRRQERLAAVGQLAAGISHDFNNILQGIVMASEVLRLSETLPPRLRRMAGDITDEGHRGARLIRQILDFSRHAVTTREPVNLASLLEETVTLLRRTIPESVSVELRADDTENVVLADPTQLQQVVTNLALNARDAMPDGGVFAIALDTVEVGPGVAPPSVELRSGRWARLTFADNGRGIPESVRPHVFEPFFTTKEAGRGTGLGLAQVYGIVNQHRGHVEFETEVDHGTVFTVFLPLLEGAYGSLTRVERPEPRRGHGEVVLVVDDDPTLLRSTAAALEQLGYHPLTARSGHEALELVQACGAEVAVVLADVVMPGLGGVDVFETLRELATPLPVVLMTGYPLDHDVSELEDLGVAGWLRKPFSLEQLAAAVDRGLGQYEE